MGSFQLLWANMNFKKFMESIAFEGDYSGIFQRLVAASYMISPTTSPAGVVAFKELETKLKRQYELLSSKYSFGKTSDPTFYNDTPDLRKDVDRQISLGVKKPIVKAYEGNPEEGDAGDPAWDKDFETKTRYVHDLMAHLPQKKGGARNDMGYTFKTARGEYGAYNRHLKTLCPDAKCLAAGAMFTEVVAQTSCYFVYKGFVEQKAIILDDFDFGNVGHLSPSSDLNVFFVPSRKDLEPRIGFDWNRFASSHPPLAAELLRQNKINPSLKPI